MVVIEGYDLIAFSTVVPILLRDPNSGYGTGEIGMVAAAVFVGTMIGALASGPLADRFGRRPIAIGSVVTFTLFGALCGVAAGPVSLGLLRLLTGIGIGALVPAASALTMEFATTRHRTLAYTVMLSGVPLGGVGAALTGLVVLPTLGWRWMFFLSLVPGLFLIPVLLRWLPESHIFTRGAIRKEGSDYLVADDSVNDEIAPESALRERGGIFAPRFRAFSLLFASATFCGMFVWFGLATWLPGIMSEAGYELGSSLLFLLTLNLGAVVGSLFIAAATDRWGNRPVVVCTYFGLTLALFGLSMQLPQPLLSIAIVCAGIGGHGGQILINAFVGASYPDTMRARALGWSLGAGRLGTIVGPLIIGSVVGGSDPLIGFIIFAALSAGAAAILAVIRPRSPRYHGAAT
ncbi:MULTISPECIES: MFS transporter [unclassified Pseudonocardia]|uniref:MFS transporter n=1 Tax=unclassified Pseudonocardia TaxID=2619320 RepID=UPI00143BA149|nr:MULTISPECIES: MFS transporter [unclassified Pseudonocardia]